MPLASSRVNVFRLKHRDALVLGIATFLGVFALDRLTSDEFSLTALYLLPVLLISWNCGRSWGLAFAILSVAAQSGQTPLNASQYTRAVYLYIAYANEFLEYVIMVVLTGVLRRIYEQERFTARIDPLTGARNRKGFQEALATEVARHQRKLRAITRLRRWQVSFSIGVAVFRTIPGSATLAMEFADRLMYAAKKQGKGVTVWNVFGDAKTAPVVWHIGVAGARPAQRASG